MERKQPLVDARFATCSAWAMEASAKGGLAMALRKFLFLPDNDRFADIGLLLLRCVTGAFLVYQSHDNVFSAARMVEFEKFLAHFGFIYPELMAPLSVYWQFVAGIGFILGLLTRWLGLITAFNFVVAVWMVHWNDPVPGIWPAAILIFLGLYFGLRGSGRYGVDAILEGKAANRRR
jgi:putative oxidoreductase